MRLTCNIDTRLVFAIFRRRLEDTFNKRHRRPSTNIYKTSGRSYHPLLSSWDFYPMVSSNSVTSQQAVDVDDDARMTRRVLWKLDFHILPILFLVSIQFFEIVLVDEDTLISSSYGCQIFSTEVTSETQGTLKAKSQLRCMHCCLIITSFIGLQGLKETYICMETNSIPLWQVSDLEFNIDICLVLTDLSQKQFTMPRNYIHIPLVSLPIIHNSNFSVIALWKFRPISP